jgi:ankyrin repeat protein/uncharacterized protein YndB with AHSA1/START domain
MTVIEQGEIRPDADRCAVRFERLYDATPEELWAALTDPEQLPGWLAHTSRFQLEIGGEIHLDFGDGDEVHGHVRDVDPGRVVEYTWDHTDEIESIVRFEIVPREHGVLLVLDHRQLPREKAAEYGAGWHAHLDMLEARLGGAAREFSERYHELRPAYDERAAELGHDWSGVGGTELHVAVAAGDDDHARTLARERPELREAADAEGLLPALRALYVRGPALAHALLPGDERLDAFHAAAFGRVERLRALLADDAARANAVSADGFTPLHLACFGGSAEAVRALLERGADPEVVSRNPQVRVRPLGTAAFTRSLDCARALLEAGADPNGAGDRGFRALHTAAQNGDAELARLLLDRGADPGLATEDGRTPESIARGAGHEEVARLLAGQA